MQEGHPRSDDVAKLIAAAVAVGIVVLVVCLILRHSAEPTIDDLLNRPFSDWGDDPMAGAPWPARHPWWTSMISFVAVLLIGRVSLFMRRIEDRHRR